MNKVIVYLVCGIDYEDHVNDRAYYDRIDAETRMQHLKDWCNKMPTWPSNYPEECNAIEAWEQLGHDQEKFCEDHDYPRNMDNITKFRIEELEIYGIE